MGKVEYYLYMQFREHANRVNLNKLEQNQCPELELVADFKKENLPRGMCAFFKDSNELYMVGGERTLRDYNYWRFGNDDDDPKDAFSCDVFVLDSSTGKISPAPRFPKPNAAKTNARALATINGKVYVMNFMPYFYKTGLPSFECFDCLKFEWEELPAPPDCVMDGYCYHFVVGPKIYLRSLYGFYCYNVDESLWESVIETTKWQLDLSTIGYDSYDESESDSDEMEIQDHSVPMKLAPPYHSICFAEPGKGGLAVGFTPKGLAAYLFAPDGELQFQQLLHSLNKDPKLPSPIETYFGGKVCHAGDSKFCLILSGRISQPTWSLGVATFDVKFKTSDGGGIHFYHENPLCYHQFDDLDDNYNIPWLYDYHTFSDAFVMYSHSISPSPSPLFSLQIGYVLGFIVFIISVSFLFCTMHSSYLSI